MYQTENGFLRIFLYFNSTLSIYTLFVANIIITAQICKRRPLQMRCNGNKDGRDCTGLPKIVG